MRTYKEALADAGSTSGLDFRKSSYIEESIDQAVQFEPDNYLRPSMKTNDIKSDNKLVNRANGGHKTAWSLSGNDAFGSAMIEDNRPEAALQRRYRAMAGMRPSIQRTIYYGDQRVTNFSALWKEVGGKLKEGGRTVYGRRLHLKELYDDNQVYRYTDTSELISSEFGDFDPPKVDGRVRPGWTGFWSSVPVPNGFHRRHIVLSSHMRRAIYSVTDKNNPDDLKIEYKKLCSSSSNDLSELEATLVSAMHNNRFNIFLGQGGWNSAIGGLASIAHDRELHWMGEIEEACNAYDMVALKNHLDDFWDEMDRSNVFGRVRERDTIMQVYDDILYKSFKLINKERETLSQDENADPMPYNNACENLLSMIQAFFDSMAFDLSQAQDDEYRAKQNEELNGFHGLFGELITTGDLSNFVNTFNNFMALERFAKEAIQKLGKDKWITAITEPG